MPNAKEEKLRGLQTYRANIQKVMDSEEQFTGLEWLSLVELRDKVDNEIQSLLN